jgi:hypothetical protein
MTLIFSNGKTMKPNEERIAIAKTAVAAALKEHMPNVASEFNLDIVGSTYIADTTDRDVDILVLSPFADIGSLTFSGWDYDGSCGPCPDNPDAWMSWKKTVDGVEINMLICSTKAYITAWLTAAEVCRFLHLSGIAVKSAVVHGIHEIIMDDSTADAEMIVRTY